MGSFAVDVSFTGVWGGGESEDVVMAIAAVTAVFRLKDFFHRRQP
jgi:hypothetical protein